MIDKSLFKLKGSKAIVAFLIVTAILHGFAIIMQAKYLAVIVTNLFDGEKLSMQLLPLLLFIFYFMLRQMIILLSEKRMESFSITTGSFIRKSFLNKLFKQGSSATQSEGTGHLITLALEGVAQFETYVRLFFPKLINMLILPMMIFFYTLMLDRQSALILVLVLPTLVFFMTILGMAAKRKANSQYEVHQSLSNHFVDSLRGLETLRLLGLSKQYDRNIEQVSERYRKSTMSSLKFAFLSSFALDFFSTLSVAIIALFLGLHLIDGEMQLLPALTILILSPEYFIPIRDFGSDYHATLNGKNAWKQIASIITKPEQQCEETKSISDWNADSELMFSQVSFRHDYALNSTLEKLSFSIKGYSKVGIIGTSGAGKSTLIDLLSGNISPTSGEITVNGQQLHTFNTESWQKQLLYIPQHPYIFHDTIASNIAFYTPQASTEDIQAACKQAGLMEVIATLSKGIDEMIGEGGRLLSGGQEQRIALARAFLDKERKILLFDEPTAHLDIETEWELKQRMLPLFENRLVFFATHRLHWMLDMDYIIVLHEGEIVEAGTHEELLQKQQHYYKLVQAQANEVQYG